jgi:GxxExxY protein
MITTEAAEDRRESLNALTSGILEAAFKVHSALGPGLLESAYEVCLTHELKKRGLAVETQVPLPVFYDGIRVDLGYRIDIVVEDEVFVELKAVEAVRPVHRAQLLSYLRLNDKRVGLLINFHVQRLKEGIFRVVNNF